MQTDLGTSQIQEAIPPGEKYSDKGKLTSRYLVEQTYLLSSTKKLFQITEESIELLNFNQEKQDQIDFDTITNIQVNEHNEKEFTIITNNNQHNQFTCSQRNRLITEILKHFVFYTFCCVYMKQDPFQQQEKEGRGESLTIKWQEREVVLQKDIYNEEGSSFYGTFQIHNSSIQFKYNANSGGEEETNGSLIKMSQSPIKLKKDSLKVNDIIHYIDIEQLRYYDTFLYVVKNNLEVYKFVFPITKASEIVSHITKNCKAYLNLQLDLVDMKKEEEKSKQVIKSGEQGVNEIEILNNLYNKQKKTNVIYRQEGKSFVNKELAYSILIELTDENLFLSELNAQNDYNLRSFAHLKDLFVIVIDGNDKNSSLSLIFQKQQGPYIEINGRFAKMEELITVILSLRSLLRNNSHNLQFFNHKPDFSQIILGLSQSTTETDYETTIFKKIVEFIPEDKKMIDLESNYFRNMNQLIFNGNFQNVSKLETKTLRDFANEIKRIIKCYLKHEDDIDDSEYDFSDDSDEYDTDSQADSNMDENEYEDYSDYDQYNSSQSSDEEMGQVTLGNFGAGNIEFKKELEKNNLLNMYQVKLSYMLCMFKNCLSSRQIFREILAEFEDIIHKFYNNSESRTESNNKRLLLKSNLDLMKYIRRGLTKYHKLLQRKGVLKSLYIWNHYEILSALICDRKETTQNDIFWYITTEIFDKKEIKDINGKEEKKDIQLIHIIDRFSINLNISLTFGFTRIINELFRFLYRGDINKFKDMQGYFLVYTVQFIYNIQLCLETQLEAQRLQSILIIKNIAYKNKYAVNILKKIFQKSLFQRVETALELFTNYNWEENEWNQFFKNLLTLNLDTPTEQWNAQTLAELLKQLTQKVNDFQKAKIKHQKILQKSYQSKCYLDYHTHEFYFEKNQDKKISTRIKILRWNFDELSVHYSNKVKFLKVWKFYLYKLLNEGSIKSGEQAALTLKIINPDQVQIFWDELNLKFMPTQDNIERAQILKVLILLYKQYHTQLKELRTLPYWIKLLEFKEYRKCQFLLLQLVLQAISVQQNAQIAHKNSQTLIECDGLQIIIYCLYQIFSELLNQIQAPVTLQLLSIAHPKSQKQPSTSELLAHMEGQDQVIDNNVNKKHNYTDYIKEPQYFNNNSDNINIGILSFKILDIIMSKGINQHLDPLPKNKKFILQDENISVITSLMLLLDNKLTGEILNFIEKHFDSHYALYQFRNSGIVEFLMLYLDTELAEQAFKILLKMQEVSLDYNDDFDFNAQFDQNDLNILMDDDEEEEIQNNSEEKFDYINKDKKISKYSIFLRYLPLPFIQKVHQTDNQRQFIEIFQSDSYEKATLIWNKQMKDKLKESILENSEELQKQLKDFANFKIQQEFLSNRNNEQNILIPKYKGPLKNKIKYDFIESEVRCGQYYLRVWTQQKRLQKKGEQEDESLRIPVNEEQYLLEKLKYNLELIIEKNEHIYDQTKLIILIRSCLLALQTFQKKRLSCLQEIKIVLESLTKAEDLEYNDLVKETLFVGLKTIYTAIHIGDKDDYKTKDDKIENLREVIQLDEIQMINDVIGFILYQQQLKQQQKILHSGQTSQAMSAQPTNRLGVNSEKIDDAYDFPISLEEKNKTVNQFSKQFNYLKLDKFEAKALLYAIKALKLLIIEDEEQYLEKSLAFRTTLFKEITQVLEISYDIYQSLRYKFQIEKNKNMPFMINQTFQSPVHDQDQIQTSTYQTNRMFLSQIPRFHQQQKNFVIGSSNLGGLEDSLFQDQESQSLFRTQLPFKPTSNQSVNTPQQHVHQQQQQTSEQSFSKKHTFTSTIKKRENYKLQLELSDEPHYKTDREQILRLIFQLSNAIASLGKDLSMNFNIHPEMIQSGFAWKCLQHIFFSLLPEFKNNAQVQVLLQSTTYTLQHLTSFAIQFLGIRQSSETPQNYANQGVNFDRVNNDKERSIIKNYYDCIKKLFDLKIMNNLECNFDFDRSKQGLMKFFASIQEKKYQNFIKIFSTPEEKTSELIWNEQSRFELSDILKSQLQNIEYSFSDQILNFDYSVNKNELRVEGIYVKNLNSDIYFQPAEINKFVEGLIKAFKAQLSNEHLVDLKDQEFDNVLEILKALRTLIQYQNSQVFLVQILDTNNFKSADLISLFCSILKQKDYEYSEESDIKMQTIASIVFDIFKIISKIQIFAEYLINNLEFNKLITRAFSISDKEFFLVEDLKSLVNILSNILNNENIETDKFLIKNGQVLFFLHVVFDKSFDRAMRHNMAKLIKLKIDEVQNIVRAFLPIHFFTMGEFVKNNVLSEDEMIKLLINNLDAYSYENQFLIWNLDLKEQQHIKIKQECKRIMKELKSCEDFENFDAKVTTQPYQNPKFQHEIIICGIIVRIFNKNPYIFINTNLEQFLEGLVLKMDKLNFLLCQIIDLLQKNDVDFDAKYEDQVIEVQGKLYTSKQIRKKLRYISHQSQYVLTAILLTIEQILYNDQNPNKRSETIRSSMMGKSLEKDFKEEKGGYMQKNAGITLRSGTIQSQQQLTIIKKKQLADESKIIPDIFYQYIEEWIKDNRFQENNIPVELRITFQQLIFLVLEIPEVHHRLVNSLMIYLNLEITKITTFAIEKLIEKFCILAISAKFLMKIIEDKPTMEKFFEQNFTDLVKIHSMFKQPLSHLIDFILCLFAQNQKCKETFIQHSIQPEYMKDKDHNINWKEIIQGRYDQEYLNDYLNLWVTKRYISAEAHKKDESRKEESKKEEILAENFFIDRKLEDSNLTKLKLPLISKKAIEEIKREDAYGEDELNSSNLVQDVEKLEQKEIDWERNKEITLELF